MMDVLIVESEAGLCDLWRKHLVRSGMNVRVATTQEDATQQIVEACPDIIILDLVLRDGSALAVSDFASYRCPDTQVIFFRRVDLCPRAERLRLCSKPDPARGSCRDGRTLWSEKRSSLCLI